MVVLLAVRDASGRIVRQCNANCHKANPDTVSRCVCGGRFRGIARQGIDPATLDPDALQSAREAVPLDGDQHLQLKIGA